jgi:hypothetical protein
MLRFLTVCGLFGMAGGFLIISPSLRESINDIVAKSEGMMSQYQPFSTIGVGVALVLALGCYMYRCSLPR